MLDATEASHPNEDETPTLQPMRLGDILDTIFSLYRNQYPAVFGDCCRSFLWKPSEIFAKRFFV